MLKATPTTTWSARATTITQPRARPAMPPATTAAAKPSAPPTIAAATPAAAKAPSSMRPSTARFRTPARLAIRTASAPSRSGTPAVAADWTIVSMA
jgi:hypothetical protein